MSVCRRPKNVVQLIPVLYGTVGTHAHQLETPRAREPTILESENSEI